MRLAIFDLDYTLWFPEMNKLKGPPMLYPVETLQDFSPGRLDKSHVDNAGLVLVDSKQPKTRIQVFDGAAYALREIKELQELGYDIKAAIASCCDEPIWALYCMKHLHLEDGRTIAECFPQILCEIRHGLKHEHIRRLHKTTGISFSDMCFFDNELHNIKAVQQALPEVRCFHTPNGMTRQAWMDAKKELFARNPSQQLVRALLTNN